MGCNPLKCTCGKKHYLPQRYLIAIMSLTGILVGYGQRVSLNIAITVMTDKNASVSTECPARNSTFSKQEYNISGGVIPWSNKEQNMVLSSFYPGYLVGHIPAGIWSDKYGARYIMGMGMVLSTITTVLTPIIVVYTPYFITMVLRNVMGIGQAVIFPAISCLYAHWVPPQERSTLGSFSFAASSLGNICGNLFTGWIIKLTGNWPISFYFWGLQGGIWCTIFMIYIFSAPSTSPRITAKEKQFIEERIHQTKKTLKIPWLAFAKDGPLWVLLFISMGHDFTLFTLVNNFPKYLSDVQRFDLAENAMATSFPYATQWISGVVTGQIIDYLVRKKGASLLWCRRIASTIGMTGSACFLVAASYMGCNGNMVVVFFCFTLLTKGAIYTGFRINHLDMSINFAGILMALVNGIGAITGWISPNVINLVAQNNTIKEWQYMFWIVWIVSFLTNIAYIFCSVATRRKWDYEEDEMDNYYKEKEERNAKKQNAKDERRKKKEKKKTEKEGEKQKGDKRDQPTTSI